MKFNSYKGFVLNRKLINHKVPMDVQNARERNGLL